MSKDNPTAAQLAFRTAPFAEKARLIHETRNLRKKLGLPVLSEWAQKRVDLMSDITIAENEDLFIASLLAGFGDE